MYSNNVYFATSRVSLQTLLLFFFVALTGSSLSAQITQDFTTPPAGTKHYVDTISPLTQHILPNSTPPQTQPNAATDGNMLGYQVTYTPTRTPDVNGGLADGELFGVVEVTVPASTTNDMGTLGIEFENAPPPSGNNRVYILDDPDGLATLRFNPVMVDASTMFSMSYIIANTSFENSDGTDDRISIYLENLGDGSRIELFSATNELIPRDEMWATLSQDLSTLDGATIQLVVEFDTNSSAEEMALDNIIFSSGSLVADWPACADASLQNVAQTPLDLCPGVPFRIAIDGNLNNAAEWVIYTDAEATQEVGRTSSTRFEVAASVPGTTYFIRGEGGCTTPTPFTSFALTTLPPEDCLPDATPGTSFEEPLGSSENYFDTGDPLLRHNLVNNPGQPSVNHPFVARELGFASSFLPSRSESSGEAGLTDGDAFGVSNDADFAFPDGNQGFVFEDTDGTAFLTFSPVDITGLTGVTVSFDYFVNATSYEASASGTDFFQAALTANDINAEFIVRAEGQTEPGLTNLETGVWTTLTYEITTAFTRPVKLFFTANFDSGTERVIIDNISFSAGTIVCEDLTAPVVSCPDPIMINANENCSGVATFEASATDDCSSAVALNYSLASGSTFAVGTTSVTVTATDESGKSSMCTFDVTVNDVTPPVLDCPAITVEVDSATNCTFVVPDDTLDPLATDNCGTVTLLSSNGLPSLAGDSLFVETTEVSWTATDAAGLMSTCTQQVNIIVPPNCFPTSVASQDASDFIAVRAIPNPFRAGTTISFELPVNTRVGIDILDLSGRVLTTDVVVPSGNNTYSWYWDAQQQALPAGVYFARLRAKGSVYTQRLVLIE